MCPRRLQELECEIAEMLARVCCVVLQRAAVPRTGRWPAPLHLEEAIDGVLGTSKSDLHPEWYSGTGSVCAWTSAVFWER